MQAKVIVDQQTINTERERESVGFVAGGKHHSTRVPSVSPCFCTGTHIPSSSTSDRWRWGLAGSPLRIVDTHRHPPPVPPFAFLEKKKKKKKKKSWSYTHMDIDPRSAGNYIDISRSSRL
jgi:hypothetical protein